MTEQIELTLKEISKLRLLLHDKVDYMSRYPFELSDKGKQSLQEYKDILDKLYKV